MAYNSQVTASRVRKLRERRGMTQTEMAHELSKKGIMFGKEPDTGKQTVSQLERGATGITYEKAIAYADVFNVSLDYILGRTDDWDPAYKSVKDLTGLTDEAIREIEFLQNSPYHKTFDVLSRLLEAGIASMLGGLELFVNDYCREAIKAESTYDSYPDLKDESVSRDGTIQPYITGAGKKIPGLFSMAMNLDSYRDMKLRIFGDKFVRLLEGIIEKELQKRKDAMNEVGRSEAVRSISK